MVFFSVLLAGTVRYSWEGWAGLESTAKGRFSGESLARKKG
jgi:hypothetical protein